ncbi:MAG TPA: MFS transporter [Dongiaceae bacterium]|jgi:MFS family permease
MTEHPSAAVARGGETADTREDLAAWIIVGLCFLALAVSFSARTSLSQIMELLEKDLGWSRSQTAAAASLAQIFMAIAAPIVGNMVDKLGPRFLLSAGLVAVGGGVMLAAGASDIWQFYFAYSVIAGIGFGTAATHVVSTIISLRFTSRRGLAVGIATAGATAGQFIVLPILARVLESTDWRTAYIALGAACLAFAPVTYAAIKSTRRAPRTAARGAAADGTLAERLIFLLRSKTFHLLFWSYFICGVTTSGVIEAHFIPYGTLCGFTLAASSDALAILMVFNLGGMVLAGWLSDRMHRPLLLGSIYVLRGLTFLILMAVGTDYTTLVVFAALFGIFDYSTVPVTASLAASHLGLRILGLSMGLLTAAHAIGAAVGAQMGGTMFDLLATYVWTWIVSLIVALLAGVLCYIIAENQPRRGILLVRA